MLADVQSMEVGSNPERRAAIACLSTARRILDFESGDEQTGVTIMKMDAGVDTGGIVAQKTLPLHQTETFSELKDALAAEGASLLLRQLPSYLSGQNEPKIQNNAAATGTAARRTTTNRR